MIKRDVTAAERRTIEKIATRAVVFNPAWDHDDLVRDIEAVHCNGCPLDLEMFLSADDFNFVHDVAGIVRHLDRETGELTDFFLPRCELVDRAAWLLPSNWN
jgi:hypothetical protein